MNPRSLRFRLISWYALVLLGAFSVLGAITYLAMHDSLTRVLTQAQFRRAREVAHLLATDLADPHDVLAIRLQRQIEESFAPAQNNRFIRVTRDDGQELYRSATPADRSFRAADLPAPQWPKSAESSRRIPLADGNGMILASQVVGGPGATRYLIETAAPLAVLRESLSQWLVVLAVVLPILAAVAIVGGYLLLQRALRPVDEIVASAEHLSSHNLSHRLPVPATGDELQRLATALNHMIQRLETALQYSRRFVADASHELRTPLAVLRMELETGLAELGSRGSVRDRLGSALEEVARLSQIVEGLFAISRLDAGEAATEWVPFDLAELASSTAEQMTLLAEDKGIHITCGTARGLWVEGDRARMKQVVVNLLDNAIKYTPEGGRVSLHVGSWNDRAWLEVTDTGIGIPAEALPLVFERFFRVDKVRSRQHGGGGLGLSIVKSICTAHRGHVEAESTLGQGSVFRVELPLTTPPPSPVAPPPSSLHEAPLH